MKPGMKWLVRAALVAAVGGTALPAHADRFQWSAGEPAYPEIEPWEWVVGGAALTGGIAAFLFWHPDEPRWQGTLPLDGPVRDALLVRDDDTRGTLSIVSEVPFYLLMFGPSLLDVGLVVGAAKGRGNVAGQLIGMNLMSYGVAALLAYTVSTLTARERPFTQACRDNPNYDSGCGDVGSENSSFFSGHVAASFTGAGTTCAHHQFLPLYGGGWADTAVCAIAMTLASSVAVLRLMTDNHYLSDVVVGAGIGLGAGYALPYLLHYQHALFDADVALLPQPMEGGMGVMLSVQ